MVELSDEPGAVARFEAGVLEASEAYPPVEDAEELGIYDLKLAADDRDRNQAAAEVVARGLLVVGAVGLIIGLLGVAQSSLRHLTRGLGVHAALPALGLERRQRLLVALLPFAVVSTPIVALVTVAGAIALSPLLPIGVARRLEPSPGVELNVAVLATGVVAAALLFLLVAGLVALRASRRETTVAPREWPLLGRWATSGLPMPVTVGTGLAFERGRGGTAAPVRAALVGGMLAVAAAVGSASFAASLDRLVETPERFGAPGDLMLVDARDEAVGRLRDDPDVDAMLEARGFDLLIDGSRRDAFGTDVLKGSIGFNYLSGRAPSGPAEVAVGPAMAARIGKDVGDTVRLGDVDRDATIVGIVLARGDTSDRYADTAIVDDEVRREVSGGGSHREVMVRFAEGVDIDAASEELAVAYEVVRSEPPSRVRDLGQIRNLPLVLAGAAALLGLALLGHALVVTVRRRGHDLALLRALGARPRDTVLSVLAMTVIIVTVGVVVGVPVGLLLGNLTWRVLAESLYVASDLAVPVLALVLILPAALAVGLVVAAVPTHRAANLEVAELLRRE
jgi:predicted lysophospholipase L1 biosynthesis ABC-type transport system permease subunit